MKEVVAFTAALMINAHFVGPLDVQRIACFAAEWIIADLLSFAFKLRKRLLPWRTSAAVVIVFLSLCAASCQPLTAPTTQRNPDGSPHIPGSPLKPWINSDVQTGNFTLPPVSR